MQGVCPFWAPWLRWPQRPLERGRPPSLPLAASSRVGGVLGRSGRAWLGSRGLALCPSPWGSFWSSSSSPSRSASPVASPILFLLQKKYCRCRPQLPPHTPLAAVVRAGRQLGCLAYPPPPSASCPQTPSPVRLSGLRAGLLCGGLGSPPSFSRGGVQGPRGKVAGPGSPSGSWSLHWGKGCGPGLHERDGALGLPPRPLFPSQVAVPPSGKGAGVLASVSPAASRPEPPSRSLGSAKFH